MSPPLWVYSEERYACASVTGQLADAIGNFACLVFLFSVIFETASCLVRDSGYWSTRLTEL